MRREIIFGALLLCLVLLPCGADAQVSDKVKGFDYVESMLQRRRWGEARVELERLGAQLNPVTQSVEVEWVEYHKVRCAVELGVGNELGMMKEYLRRYPQSLHRNDMAFLIASYECDNANFEEADRLFDEVDYKSLSANDKERYDIRVGYLRFINGEHLYAKTHFSRIPKISEYYPHALYYLSYMAYSEGRDEDAERTFKELAKFDTYKDIVPYYLLQLEYRKGNFDGVITQGEPLLKVASTQTQNDLIRIIAESYFVKGDYSNAIRHITSLPEECMGRQENYIKGYSLYRMARYRDAVEPLKRVCGAEDDLTQNASYHLGDSYLRLGDKPHAADAFAMASVDGFNGDIAQDALLNYGRLKYELGGGMFNEAVNVLQEYLRRYPHSTYCSEVKELLIAAFYNSKDYDAAYTAIKDIENPDKDIRAAHQKVAVFRAIAAIERGDWALGEELLRESETIGLVPKYNALTLYWQGEVAYHKGDMALAAQKYEDYVRRAPKNESEYFFANYGIGYAYLNLKDMDKAQQAFTTFVRDYTMRDNYLYDAHNRLGDSYFASRNFSDARKAYKVVAQAPVDYRHYANYQLAMVDGIDKKTNNKIERLKSIVSDNMGDYVDDAWYELGRTYLSLERYKDGAETLRRFVDNDATSEFRIPALSDLALAYYNLDRKGDARKCYEAVVEFDPQSAAAMEAMRGIREIYVSEGRVDEYFAYAERSGVQSDMSIAARDSLNFAVAKNLYLGGDMESAQKRLVAYLDSFEKGYNRTEALFYLSDCYVALDQNGEALATMRQLLESGKSQYTERVLGVYAPMSFDQKEYEASAKAYRELYDVANDSAKRAVAAEGYVEATALYGDGVALKAMADDVAKMNDASKGVKAEAKLLKANVLRSEGNYPEAMDIYAELSKKHTDKYATEAYYYLVEYDFNRGDYDRAEERVYALGECDSVYWQAKIFLILGDIFVQRGNSFQARATYQSIVDGYGYKDDGILDEAKKRIASLK